MSLKGVILAGGKGTRLWPLTEVTNKHLAPVGPVPMIEYPFNTLHRLGIDSACVVTGGEHFQNISNYLANTHREFKFSFHPQLEAGGIAQALSLTEPYARGDNLAVILGDNIYENDFSEAARRFEESGLGAMLFLKPVTDPERFGVAEVRGDKIVSIEEKPKVPRSNLAVTGLYFYDSSVFSKISEIKPSLRGELEITDVNNLYIKEERLGYEMVPGFWSDAGTHKSRDVAERHVLESGLSKRLYDGLTKNNPDKI